jgi:hypothetical protein
MIFNTLSWVKKWKKFQQQSIALAKEVGFDEVEETDSQVIGVT